MQFLKSKKEKGNLYRSNYLNNSMQVTVMLLKKSQTESSQLFPFQKCLFYKYKIVKYSNSS